MDEMEAGKRRQSNDQESTLSSQPMTRGQRASVESNRLDNVLLRGKIPPLMPHDRPIPSRCTYLHTFRSLRRQADITITVTLFGGPNRLSPYSSFFLSFSSSSSSSFLPDYYISLLLFDRVKISFAISEISRQM